jgi:ribosomal-protein-alanine N-acetyltransferase
MKHYQLLPMDRTHLLDVAALERECFTTPWTEEMLAEELYNDTASFLVAQADDGEVLGYAGLHVVLDEGYIDNIAVKAKYRRLGVAGELLGAFLRFGQANLAFLTLEVRPSNKPAIAFYLKHGFAQVGRRRDYYDKPREDAILMTREFSR